MGGGVRLAESGGEGEVYIQKEEATVYTDILR